LLLLLDLPRGDIGRLLLLLRLLLLRTGGLLEREGDKLLLLDFVVPRRLLGEDEDEDELDTDRLLALRLLTGLLEREEEEYEDRLEYEDEDKEDDDDDDIDDGLFLLLCFSFAISLLLFLLAPSLSDARFAKIESAMPCLDDEKARRGRKVKT